MAKSNKSEKPAFNKTLRVISDLGKHSVETKEGERRVYTLCIGEFVDNETGECSRATLYMRNLQGRIVEKFPLDVLAGCIDGVVSHLKGKKSKAA